MKISAEKVKELREMTSSGIMDCRRALQESKGDVEKAKVILRKKGLEIAAKKAMRATNEGRIEAYVHLGNKIGVLVEVNCETDFVARNEEFKQFTKDIAMHIAASDPAHLKRDDVSKDIIKDEKNPDDYYKTNCLLDQPFVKDQRTTVQEYLNSVISKTGENVSISRFVRFKLGEQ
ncbi:translation elongation factor Ts [Candidatus Omnitrophota bacterium]